MKIIIPVADLVAVLFTSLIFLGLFQTGKEQDALSKRFERTVAVMVIFTFIDFLSYIIEDHVQNDLIITIVDALTYLGSDVCLICFTWYAWSFINEKKKISGTSFFIILGGSLIDIVMILIGVITGSLFSVHQGVCQFGPMENIIGIIPLGLMIYFVCFAITKQKAIGNAAVISIFAYMLFPAAFAIAGIVDANITLTYVAACFSMVIVYILLQSGEIYRSRMREDMMMSLLRTDSLTGLYNRRSYDENINEIKEDQAVYILFCDVNGLKRVNDASGHAAGDKLLIDFSEKLKNYFPYDKIFRISGDEFVVMILDGSGESVEAKAEDFKQNIRLRSWEASVGYSNGIGKNILQVISNAELAMYRDKNDYYITTKQDRRRS